MLRTRDEYGGFLPLELNEGEEYYNYPLNKMIRFNCAKAAISCILDKIEADLVYLPYYLCPNVCKEIEHHKIHIKYYHLDKRLLPENVEDKADVCIYLVDYFGVMDKKIAEYVGRIKHAKVIIDNSHAFFNKPIISLNIYNIYSCKKFFGVPDGAYLISKHLDIDEMPPICSSNNSLYLLECVEHGTNYCYQKKIESDKWLAENHGGMSVLAKRILEAIDYEKVKKRRYDNFSLYHEAFSKLNLLNCEDESVPYMYPLNVQRNIKKELIENKIYVPTLWAQLIDIRFRGDIEYMLSDKTIFLPVDQRYNKNDICFIIEKVKGILDNDN